MKEEDLTMPVPVQTSTVELLMGYLVELEVARLNVGKNFKLIFDSEDIANMTIQSGKLSLATARDKIKGKFRLQIPVHKITVFEYSVATKHLYINLQDH